jgi:hypothetical protein
MKSEEGTAIPAKFAANAYKNEDKMKGHNDIYISLNSTDTKYLFS